MEIIKPGKIPEAKKIVFTCSYCGCVFKCTRSEVTLSGGSRNDYYYKHPCPTCHNTCYVEEGKL